MEKLVVDVELMKNSIEYWNNSNEAHCSMLAFEMIENSDKKV